MNFTDKIDKTDKTDKRKKPRRSNIIVSCTMKATPMYCIGCNKNIMNIDGCPNCKTTVYFTHLKQ